MISVILPAYNEEDNIEPAVREISAVLGGCGEDFELLFISDGSTDSTYERICAISETDSHVKGVEFSRNFGKEAAIFAGLTVSGGDAVIVMDCDLQHPVSVLPEMIDQEQPRQGEYLPQDECGYLLRNNEQAHQDRYELIIRL